MRSEAANENCKAFSLFNFEGTSCPQITNSKPSASGFEFERRQSEGKENSTRDEVAAADANDLKLLSTPCTLKTEHRHDANYGNHTERYDEKATVRKFLSGF